MNKGIKTLQDALTYQLQGLWYAEQKISEEFKHCSHQITSEEVRTIMQRYIGNADNVKLKVERVFGYLMLEPIARKNEVIDKMIAETQHLVDCTYPPYLRDILLIACFKNLNAYKVSTYETAHLMAIEMELETAGDLIGQVLSWELTTGRELSGLSMHEFNKANSATK